MWKVPWTNNWHDECQSTQVLLITTSYCLISLFELSNWAIYIYIYGFTHVITLGKKCLWKSFWIITYLFHLWLCGNYFGLTIGSHSDFITPHNLTMLLDAPLHTPITPLDSKSNSWSSSQLAYCQIWTKLNRKVLQYLMSTRKTYQSYWLQPSSAKFLSSQSLWNIWLAKIAWFSFSLYMFYSALNVHDCYLPFPFTIVWQPLWLDNWPPLWFHHTIQSGQATWYIEAETNGRHFPDDIFKCIFLNENVLILIKISLKFVPKGQINNIPALVQIMAWCRPGDKPLSEPRVDSLLTHICVTRPQWVNAPLHTPFELWQDSRGNSQ